jgi:hypothetical protein
MALVRYNKTSIVKTEEKVAVWTKGQIGLNRVLVENRNLSNYKHAILYFDPDLQKMVFQFTNDEKEAGVVSVNYANNKIGLISAKPYLDNFGINHVTSKKYPAHFDDATKTLTLFISEGVVTISKRIKKDKSNVVVPVETTIEVEPVTDIPVTAPVA